MKFKELNKEKLEISDDQNNKKYTEMRCVKIKLIVEQLEREYVHYVSRPMLPFLEL